MIKVISKITGWKAQRGIGTVWKEGQIGRGWTKLKRIRCWIKVSGSLVTLGKTIGVLTQLRRLALLTWLTVVLEYDLSRSSNCFAWYGDYFRWHDGWRRWWRFADYDRLGCSLSIRTLTYYDWWCFWC